MDKLNIILNGKIVQGNKGETILELCKRFGIEIPTLCNDVRLEPFSSCYVCVVEVEGMRGLQPSCSTKIADGMKIITNSDKVIKSRKSALELMLSNHYADCAAPCKLTCPAGVDVQGYIALINKGMFKDAVGLIKQTNPLPAICGRVCVRPCEVACRRNLVEGVGVGIDYLKRYATDMEFESGDLWKPELKPETGKKVCVIGAGPGGLSAAYYLSVEGHKVDIYESSPYPGGMLRYGIPPYRLPNDIIDKEVKNITDLGTDIYYEKKLGDNLKFADIKTKYDTYILAIGSQSGTRIGCPNDDAENVFPGIDFLRNMEMTGQRYDFTGKKVAVIGGGNTAMDCCRTAMRCGAEKVYVVYRRTEKEMPANPIEIHESKLEGIEYLFLTAPGKVNKDEEGKLKSLTCFKMELGEPDSSGRRRPVKVENSEYDIELDYILAAIGQKTNVNFIEDINRSSEEQLIINKWGDINADKVTLQTSVKNIFAAGDAVTGPATLIEAIAQGRKAARSCNQYLTGKPITGEPYEFLSRKDNFEKQSKKDYEGNYINQTREEMPTIDPGKRRNFEEVELGYSNEQAMQETLRCLECGCTEYYTCDLKRYSTEYKAEQKKYEGEYKKYEVDFRHPFVEIDNNKCILCSRCVRICKDVVGANALGLINRGFETFVAPTLAKSLPETDCESCGMCISTCPTGAISENFSFKPGPFALESFETICNYCSVGCEITIHHKNGYYIKTTGSFGQINDDTNLCRFGKFGYRWLNDRKRITKPMIKRNDKFEEVDYSTAFKLIYEKIKSVEPSENSFFAGARLSNEELYLVQKFARAAVKTNNISSFHYLNRGDFYKEDNTATVPFKQLKDAGKIYLIGSEINYENGVVGFMINNARNQGAKVEVVTVNDNDRMIKKSDRVLVVKSYYHFVKAVIHYILANNLENPLFVKDNVTGFDAYKNKLLTEDYNVLLKNSGVFFEKRLKEFAESYNNEPNAIIIFAEKNISSNTARELYNLALVTGKLGKTSSGLISMKEKNNAQGLFDMGISPEIAIGCMPYSDGEVIANMQKAWMVKDLPTEIVTDQLELLNSGSIKNLFIFGEDPIGCAVEKDSIKNAIAKSGFKVICDYFLSETANEADVLLPASLSYESGGSFTNTQKFINHFDKQTEPKAGKLLYEQLIDLMKMFGVKNKVDLTNNITIEIASLLSSIKKNGKEYNIKHTDTDNYNRMFNYGCDYLVKRFEEEFEESFKE